MWSPAHAQTPQGGAWADGGRVRLAPGSNPRWSCPGAAQSTGTQAVLGSHGEGVDREVRIVFRSPGALFPASHRTSPKLRNPKSKLGRTSPARQQGRKWVELAAARCLCYKPGTPQAETAPGGSGLWTRHPSLPVPSGFQPRPRRTAGSRETDPISRLGRHAKASRGLRSVARCCLRAPGHSSPCQALPSLLDKITTSRGTAAPQSRTAAPKPLAASRP